MASRKEQKEQARARRLEQEKAAAAKAQRTRRFQIFGGVIVAAVVVIVVAIVVSTSGGGGGSAQLQHGQSARDTYAQVNRLLGGIPQQGVTLGNPHAPVTMTYFGDLECPICKELTLDSLPQFIQQQVRPGHVKVVYRSFCTATGCPQNQSTFDTQQVAAYAAGKQNLAWQFIELFYHQQGEEDTGYVNEDYLHGLASQIPSLNVDRWKTDRGNPALLSQVQADEQAANDKQLSGTPSLIMSGSKGSELLPQAVPTYNQLAAAVQAVQ